MCVMISITTQTTFLSNLRNHLCEFLCGVLSLHSRGTPIDVENPVYEILGAWQVEGP